MAPLPPLSLYVHLPWCVRKCPYCDFNSWSGAAEAPRERYLQSLIADLDTAKGLAAGRSLISIFLGGGTPSVFTPAEIGRLLEEVGKRFSLVDDVEITMEANPGTVECGAPGGYREAGVNRLSIGAQSFDATKLAALGRIHTVDDIGRTVNEARDAGFDNINIDIMYALPGQGVAAAMHDIEMAAALQPTHISWYHLTLEPNTVFYARPPADLPDDELSYSIQQSGESLLAALGYERYEVSAFARDGRYCQHNLNYWSFGDYLAVGAGGHGKISTEHGISRYMRPTNPQQFMNAIEAGEGDVLPAVLSDEDLLFEFMLNALRLMAGFDERLFTSRTGLPVDILRRRLEPLVERELICERGGHKWIPTTTGQRFLNDLQAHFLPEKQGRTTLFEAG